MGACTSTRATAVTHLQGNDKSYLEKCESNQVSRATKNCSSRDQRAPPPDDVADDQCASSRPGTYGDNRSTTETNGTIRDPTTDDLEDDDLSTEALCNNTCTSREHTFTNTVSSSGAVTFSNSESDISSPVYQGRETEDLSLVSA